jgi:hypothetical protein
MRRSTINFAVVGVLGLVIALPACGERSGGGAGASNRKADAAGVPDATPGPAWDAGERHRDAWTTRYDFDGDGKADSVLVDFTGGAHCCYRLNVELSSSGQVVRLPFEIDGGYPEGLDLSDPSHFDVINDAAQRPVLYMEILTYNGQSRPLPRKWEHDFGIRTHHVEVSFAGGKMKVRDVAKRGP